MTDDAGVVDPGGVNRQTEFNKYVHDQPRAPAEEEEENDEYKHLDDLFN